MLRVVHTEVPGCGCRRYPRTVTIRTVAALSATVTLVLSGCSSDPEPKVLPPAPSAAPSTGALPLPSEAAAETPQGAAAFTRFYFSEVNRSYALLDPAPVRALSAPDCNSCKNIIEDIERLKAAGLTVAGDRFRLEFAEAPPVGADASAIVDFRFDADPYVEKDAAGKVVRDLPSQEDQDGQAKLVRQGTGWVLSGLRIVEA